LRSILKEDDRLSVKQILRQFKEQTKITINEKSIRRKLKKMKFKFIKDRKLYLTPQQKKMRLQFAAKHFHDDWTQVLFSNEPTINLFHDHRGGLVRPGEPVQSGKRKKTTKLNI
jgi:hypothetical protein